MPYETHQAAQARVAKASCISSGNHRTQLLVEACFHAMGTDLWRGSEAVFPSLQHPLACCFTCKSQREGDRGVLSTALLARSRHSTPGTIAAMVREIIYQLHCTTETPRIQQTVAMGTWEKTNTAQHWSVQLWYWLVPFAVSSDELPLEVFNVR